MFVVASGVVISYPWASNAVYRVMGEEPPPAGRGGRGGAAAATASRGGRDQAAGQSRPVGGVHGLAQAPATPGARGNLDRAVELAMQRQPDWQTVTLRVPEPGAASVVVQIDRGDAGQPNLRAMATVDAQTGAIRQWEDFASQSRGRRVRTVLRFMHTGEIGGLAGQTLAGLASLAGALLVYSGVALSVRRLAAWRSRQAGGRVVPAATRTQSSNGSPVH